MFGKRLRSFIRQRPVMTAGIVLALMLLTAVGVLAAEYVPTATVNGAVYMQFNPADATGTGLFNPYIRVSANSAVIHGYNTDYRPLQFDEDASWTDSISLGEVPYFLYGGILYREFQLDINQSGSNPLESLDEVQIWLGGADAATIHGFVPEAVNTDFGTFPGYTLLQVYNLDAGEDNWIKLDASASAGSGKRDLRLLVPDADFGAYGAACEFPGPSCDKYVVFYTKFGEHYANNDGFEEWGVAIYNIVSGYKWHDLNADGIWQQGEPPLADWQICAQLVQRGVDVGDPICIMTGADGGYTLPVPNGTYRIYEVCPALWLQSHPAPTGGVCGSGVYNLTVSNGDVLADRNFGNYPPPAEVTGCKLEDVDADPTTSADRVPVADWDVFLSIAGVRQLPGQKTGADGCYTWTNLQPGLAYDVEEDVPADWYAWTATEHDCGTLGPGGTCSYTFVNSERVDVTACKLEDMDANPNTSADRVPIAGWDVYLSIGGVRQLPGEKTGADGCYTWTNLQPGVVYDVEEDVPTGWVAWTPTSHNFGASVSGGQYSYTFVNSQVVDVTACKHEDVDTDPATSADRVPVAGWDVYLSIGGVRQLPGEKTGADGCYTWMDLQPGLVYDVEEDVPADWYAWTPTSHDFGASASGGQYSYTFVNSQKVNVTVCKLEDVDADPTTDADRVPVEGWTVKLTKNGVVQDTQLTGRDGCYTWSMLAPLAPPNYYDGTEVVPDDWWAWGDTSKNCDPIASGGTCTLTFVNSERVKVTACKLEDMDGDLATTADQTPLSMWPVYLSIDGVRQLPGAETGVDGCYTWVNLQPGLSYDVEEDVLTGWVALTPSEHDFGASVSGGEYSYTFINYKPKGCTYTQGYWKTHSIYGPAGPYDPTWDLKAGGDAKFLSDAWDTGFTWHSIMWEPPKKGDAYLILAHQYVATWLNINNVDPDKAADDSVLGTAMVDAEYLLGHYTPAYDFKEDPDGVRDEFIMLAGILGEFNEGYMGVPHCGD